MALSPASASALADVIVGDGVLGGMGREARASLEASSTLVELAPGERLFPPGSGADALYIVQEGVLFAREAGRTGESHLVRVIRAGEAVDGLQELGDRADIIVAADEPCRVWMVPGHQVDGLVRALPEMRAVRERLHRRQLLTRLHRLFGPLDAGLLDVLEREAEWVHLQTGEVLFEPGAPSDGLYAVISGRLAVLAIDHHGHEVREGEVARGETLGEAEFFAGAPRQHRVRALRDSVVVAYTSVEVEQLIAGRPQVLRHITAAVARRASSPRRGRRSAAAVTSIALAPASPRAPVRAFADRLIRILSRYGAVVSLTSERVDEQLTEQGISHAPIDSPDEARLLAWLEGCEARHRFVIYETDAMASTWSLRAMRRADRALFVADAGDAPVPDETELQLSAASIHATLVLVHPDGAHPPNGTRLWREARPAVRDHLHVRWDGEGDLARVARVLAGRSIGVVLGGGGARGLAHIGFLRAFAEAGIPIDAIGGTSMGASIAGQFAMGRGADEIKATTRKVFIDIKPQSGFTIPILSLVSTRRTELAGRVSYGEIEIEDLWLPFFCVSSNLTTADIMVHNRGSLWRAAVASASLPGVGTPVLHQRQLLVDGGVLNNLPTDVMRRLGYGTVIASSVANDATAAFTCERVPSVWEVMRAMMGARRAGVRFPSILDVVVRASLLHSAHREGINLREADLAVRAVVGNVGLLEFERIDDIAELGYVQANAAIDEWRRLGTPIFA